MKVAKRSLCLRILLVILLSLGPPANAFCLSLIGIFLGEPDVFVPSFGLETEIALTRSLGVWVGGAYFLSGTWDLETGLRWHPSPQFALSLQALFLFDVVDGFVPQIGAEVRWSFPLNARVSWTFFNEVGLYVPLVERFVQPIYGAGLSLRF